MMNYKIHGRVFYICRACVKTIGVGTWKIQRYMCLGKTKLGDEGDKDTSSCHVS